jgi:hypothetical protein
MMPTVAEAQADLAAHESTCPGSHFECFGNPDLERARLRWIYTKDHLKALLRMAREAEKTGWKDADGNPATPIWKASPTAQTLENRAAHEPKARSKPASTWHRPRGENPSKDALRKRVAYEKKKSERAA